MSDQKWCSYCRCNSHNDAECWSTRPKDWHPGQFLPGDGDWGWVPVPTAPTPEMHAVAKAIAEFAKPKTVLNDLIEQLDRELTLAEHYHANQQTWKLAVSLAKIQDIARKAEWECNELVMDHEYGRPKSMYHRLGCQCEQCLRIAP